MSLIESMLGIMLISATPIIFAATGLAYCEKAGVLNIGMEGIMLLSASISYTAAVYTGNLAIGVLFGLVTGLLCGFILSLLSVYLKVDQTVLGIGFWLVGLGFSSYFWWATVYPFGLSTSIIPFRPLIIPILSEIPLIGVLFRQNVMTYGAISLAVISYYVLTKTSFGLKIRAAGENPRGFHIVGGNVSRVRSISMIISCALGGLAGTFFTLGTTGTWVTNLTSGQGFIAIAIIKLVNWNPLLGILGALIFSFFISIQYQLQLNTDIPYELLLTLPYIASIVILIVVPMLLKKSKPKSLGVPFIEDG